MNPNLNTNPTFSTIDEPWITVALRDGSTDELSLLGCFERATEIRAVVGDIPTQAFALVRLLLAIIHRSLPTLDHPYDNWRELWSAPALPVEWIRDYLHEHAQRFDLLHPETPFLQVADLRTQKDEPGGLERLVADYPPNEQYFTMRGGGAIETISFAEAARWVVHAQAYDVSGIHPGAVGDPRVKGGKGYPLGTSWTGELGGILLEGPTLKDTLLLNLVLDGPRNEDTAVWERAPLTSLVEDRPRPGPLGRADILTWPSRRIRLFHDGEKVTGALVCYGDVLRPQNRFAHETMTAWRRSANQEKSLGGVVYMPIRHDPARALWRGLGGLLPRHSVVEGDATVPPGTLRWLDALQEDGMLAADYPLRVHSYGVAYGTQSSVIDEIVDDAVDMQVVVLSSEGRELAATIVDLVDATRRAVDALGQLASNLAVAAGGESPGVRDRAREQAYFELDEPFRHWLAAVAPGDSVDDQVGRWSDSARRILSRRGEELVAEAGPAAWVGREDSRIGHVSSSKAHVWFRARLQKALPRTRAELPYSDVRAGGGTPEHPDTAEEAPND